MITVLPMEASAEKEAILSSYPQAKGKRDVIVMAEKEEIFGTAVLSVEGECLCIWEITVNGQTPDALDMMGKMVADSLMRSAASYGEHNGAQRIEAKIPAMEAFFTAKGFQPGDGCMTTPMSTIVHRKKPQA